MSDPVLRFAPIRTIAAKDIRDALRDRFIIIVTAFLAIAALAALITGAIALRTDLATYEAAKASLLALGKTAGAIAAPELYPLRLLRAAIEQTQIIGAAIAILIGYRTASSERGRQTLALMMTRPLRDWQFVAGKACAGLALLAAGLAVVMILLAVTLHFASGIGLGLNDLGRIAIVWAVAVAYTACFYLMAFGLALHMRHPVHALLAAFAIWLMLVLIAPQIGDTLDPDNQVAGGVFQQLHIAKPDQIEIMKGYKTFETLRDAIEQASITKHFERFSFAVLGIKASFAGQSLRPILIEKLPDLTWICLTLLALAGLIIGLPIQPTRLAKP